MRKIFLILSLLIGQICLAYDIDYKIGQMIILGFDGKTTHSFGFKKVLKQIKNNEISGVIYFGKNIKSKEDLIKMNEKILSSSKITPFISIDNEGGQIQRYNFYNHPSAKEISKNNINYAKEEYSKMAKLEKELKFNLNFAPCVDLELNPNSIIAIKERSYGKNPETVSKYASIFIEEHNKNKILTSIKHFPGHGSIDIDTHKNFADATKTFIDDEIEPYNLLKNYNDMNMVMVSHIYNSKIDEIYPASLSKKTIKGLLINKIGFNGVIISDDYDMGAIRKNYTLNEIVVNSISSGVNILLFSNNIKTKDKNLAKKIHKIVKKEIKNGNINPQDIDNSFEKIMAIKALL
ncbi:MAG: glycoside hydrolase family 3 protein [Candidatus Gastranaerophilales bacterium]|nr:glycoside hydrolase family 3 protein [Candidatus Gastranaerophilales bacterium]